MQDPLFGPRTSQPGVRLLGVVGRLKPGVSVSQGQAEMGAMGARFAQEYPEDSGFGIRIQPYREAVVGNLRLALLVLLTAVGLVLLMACANVAGAARDVCSDFGRRSKAGPGWGGGRRRIRVSVRGDDREDIVQATQPMYCTPAMPTHIVLPVIVGGRSPIAK